MTTTPAPASSRFPLYAAALQRRFTATELKDHQSLGVPLFVYGSLMFPELVRSIISRSSAAPLVSAMTPARLLGYSRFAVLYASFPAIVEDPASHQTPEPEGEVKVTQGALGQVEGMLIFGLTPEERRSIDIYESYMYTKTAIDVDMTLVDGSVVEVSAEAYVWAQGRDELSEEDWSPELFQTSPQALTFSYLEDTEEAQEEL